MSRWQAHCAGRMFRLSRISSNEVEVNDESIKIRAFDLKNDLLSIESSDKKYDILIEKKDQTTYLAYINQFILEVVLEDELLKKVASSEEGLSLASTQATVNAPMPGLVAAVEVGIGEKVTPGSRLVVLEAMKMENQIRSTVVGTVKEVRVKPGETVEKGQVLLLLESGISNG